MLRFVYSNVVYFNFNQWMNIHMKFFFHSHSFIRFKCKLHVHVWIRIFFCYCFIVPTRFDSRVGVIVIMFICSSRLILIRFNLCGGNDEWGLRAFAPFQSPNENKNVILCRLREHPKWNFNWMNGVWMCECANVLHLNDDIVLRNVSTSRVRVLLSFVTLTSSLSLRLY